MTNVGGTFQRTIKNEVTDLPFTFEQPHTTSNKRQTIDDMFLNDIPGTVFTRL